MYNPQTLHIDTINADWCDNDIVMLHACFLLLTSFVEMENLDMIDWEHDDNTKSVKNEIDELYKWWKQRIIKEAEGKLDPIWKEGQYENDNKMPIRLINIRKYLWT